MIPATRDIWQGHPSTQAWKADQQQPDSITELHHAAWTGDISTLQTLLSQGVSISCPDKEGRTALHYAAAGNQTGAIDLLVRHGADVHQTSTTGDTAMHVAAAEGSVAALAALQIQGANPSHVNDRDQTPLYLAVEHHHTAAVQALCEASLSPVNKADEWGLTPVHIAARAGDASSVTLLLQAEADPLQQSWDKRTALHFAAQHRHPAVIRQLLLHPSLRSQPPQTPQDPPGPPNAPTHHAPQQASTSHPTHQNGLDHHQQSAMAGSQEHEPNTHCNGIDSTQAHASSLDEDVYGQQPAAEPFQDSMESAANSLQSLHSGIQYEPGTADGSHNSRQEEGSSSMGGADAHAVLDYTGEDAEAMDALLALTSDCSVQSPPQLQSPADHFRWQKHMLSLKDHQGNTALHLAVMEGQPESVQLLLQAGANINTPGQQQQTPLTIARQFRHTDVEQMLLQAGATA